MRSMADSVTLAALEPVADQFDVLAGYDDGAWPDAATLAARFPGKLVLRYTVDATDDEGDALDVETGDATPQVAPGWVQRRRAAGHGGPLVYCSESSWPDVRAAFADQGVPPPGYIVASYGAAPVIPVGAVGLQYAGTVQGPGGLYDENVIADYLPGIDPATSATTTEEGSMLGRINIGTQRHIFQVNAAGQLFHKWQSTTGPSFAWGNEQIKVPELVAGQVPNLELTASTLHVWVEGADTLVHHAFQAVGSSTWNYETLP